MSSIYKPGIAFSFGDWFFLSTMDLLLIPDLMIGKSQNHSTDEQ